MKDSFGVEIEPGDYILSASTSGARVKIGRAKQGKNGLLMDIDHSAWNGRPELDHQKSGQLAYNTVVLRKADGSVPDYLKGTYGAA